MRTFAFAFVLAMNFASYFAQMDMTPEEVLKTMCMINENKAMRDAMNACQEVKGTDMMKEIYSVCGKKLDIKEGLTFTEMADMVCAPGGDKIFYKFDKCQKEQMTEKKITKEMAEKEIQPMMDCFADKLGTKSQ